MSKSSSYTERFSSGYRFFDDRTGFMLNYAGASGFDMDSVLKKDQKAITTAIDYMKQLEAGKAVNISEGRKVDHFNLRKGAGLRKSVALWQSIRDAVEKIKAGKVLNEKNKSYTDVIMNGIGGSFLGPLMTLIAKHGNDYNFGCRLPLRIHFLSNTDAESFNTLMRKLNLSRTIMVNISKSGGTAETAGNMEAFNNLLLALKLKPGRHNITVTTPGSPFDLYSRKSGFMHVFHMNNETGGRTSVGSAVGMVPAAFAGLDFDEFLRGQSQMDKLTRRADVVRNPALILALVINDVIVREGHKNQIMLGYSDSLKEMSHYFQQLFMESLGKKKTLHGRIRKEPTGLTIMGGVGTGEQHAFMQQVQEGIRNCFVHFVSFRKRSTDFENTKAGSMGRQLLAFLEGTQRALLENKRDFVALIFEEQNEFNMGMLVALEERVVTFLGGMWNINPFDQPGVQAGKLSADNHNRISKMVVSRLLETEGFRGSALDMSLALGKDDAEVPSIEAILLDIVSNHAVAGAYPGLEGFKCTKKWKGTIFSFSIS